MFTYPTTEQYQVGVEFMGEKKLSCVMNIAVTILDKLEVQPLVQISNIKIPELLVEMFDELSINDFRDINVEKFLNLKVEWLEKLVYLQYIEQIDEIIKIAPKSIQIELQKKS